jgi:hypothetical protein
LVESLGSDLGEKKRDQLELKKHGELPAAAVHHRAASSGDGGGKRGRVEGASGGRVEFPRVALERDAGVNTLQ